MNKQQLANKIWASANKMRSKIDANEYKDYILGLIFYKFLSDNEVNYLYKVHGWTEEYLPSLVEDYEDEPKVVEFPTKNFDKDFTATNESVVERIYAQFHQEPFYMIRIGKTGFSGSVIKDAYEYYAGEVTNEQRFIKRAIAGVMKYWKEESERMGDFSIRPLRYISSEDTSEV